MDNIKPIDITKSAIELAATKGALPVKDLLLRGVLSGAILGIATTLAYTATKQSGVPLVGSLVFPVGFILIILMGFELVTGNFALLPMGVQAGKVSYSELLKNFTIVFIANLLGSLLYGILYSATLTLIGAPAQATIAPIITATAEAKTIAYAQHGAMGLAACFIKAILCNWMVCMAVIGGLSSTSSIGKMLGAGIPIFIFFAQGFEHSVVNMFVIPTGIMLGAKVSILDWWLWNQIPVTLGNFVGGWLLVGLPLYLTYGKAALKKATQTAERPEQVRIAV
jgi:formate/nitrite transporter